MVVRDRAWPLASGEPSVDIWHVDLLAPARQGVLDAAESLRAVGLRVDRDRRRFVAARAGLRLALSTRLGCPAADLRFVAGPQGKPALVGGDLQFNISHSGELALVAVSEVPVGVDVEEHRVVDYQGLARRFFAAAEVRQLAALPPLQQSAAFFACWTRKEAYLKGLGLGLSVSLSSFAVSLEPVPPGVPRAVVDRDPRSTPWRLVDLAVGVGRSACLAVAADGHPVVVRHHRADSPSPGAAQAPS